jgi:Zn-dependent peptidase ImmA (M78 family)
MDEINVTIDALADLKAVAPDLFKETLPRLGALTNAPKVAENERKRLGLTPEIQASWKSGADAFRRLRSLIEAQGAFVYVVTASTTDDWRGLAVLDERGIPFIVVNGNEYEATARCFSLMHEYAHLLRRQSAISNHRGKGIVEAFCNSFAAHFLMPEKEFKKAVHSVAGGYRSTWPDTLIKKISKPFRTSMSAVVLHLQNLGFGPDNLFAMKVEEWNSREKKERKPPFVDYYEKTTNRLGTRHIALVFDALDRGRINQLDAYEMLDVQPANFAKLRSEVKERQAAYGWRG